MTVRLGLRTIFVARLLSWLMLVLLTFPVATPAEDFTYETNNGTITITGYIGTNEAVTIPDTITGLPVATIGMAAFWSVTNLTSVTFPDSITSIGFSAFASCYGLTSVTIPVNVTNLASWAFLYCDNLTSVYFQGNTPGIGSSVFGGDDLATIYYLPNTTNWNATFAGHPTGLWLPLLLTTDGSFGVETNQFGFNVHWSSGMVVVVEASTNFVNPVWEPLQTNTLTGDSWYFSDPQWTNYPGRFYRVRWQ